MATTLTPDQVELVLSDDFLALLDADFRDNFRWKVREGTNGNYAVVNFGPGANAVLAALDKVAEPDRAAIAKQLARQIASGN